MSERTGIPSHLIIQEPQPLLHPNQPKMADYLTIHNLAIIAASITAGMVLKRGYQIGKELLQEAHEDMQEFQAIFWEKANDAAGDGILQDLMLPIRLRNPLLEMPLAIHLSTKRLKLNTPIDLSVYGIEEASARPVKYNKIGTEEGNQLWVRTIVHPSPQPGQRRTYYEIVGRRRLDDAPAQPFPIGGHIATRG